MDQTQILVLILVLPLGAAVLVLLCGRWPNLRETVSLLTGVTLLLLLTQLTLASPEAVLSLPSPLQEVPIAFAVEPLGLLFAWVASTLWLVTTVYAIGYMRAHGEENQTRFYCAFAVSISATLGLAFAANLWTLFLCYELLTLSTYPLVTHSGTDDARRGGRVYLGVLLSTSIGPLLLAMIITLQLAGSLDFVPEGLLTGKAPDWMLALLLLLYTLGIGKAAIMPLHRWLPAAMVAPTPVSALLHAVAVVKAGVFTVIKVTAFIIGADFLSDSVVRQGLIYLALLSMLMGGWFALKQDNLKLRLAYSTVSQLGYITLGALLANVFGMMGAGMHIAMHGVAKITLFFAAGAILVATHKTNISDMAGLGQYMPITFGCFLVASLSIIGIPPLGGFWSKWYLAQGAIESQQWLALAVLMGSSLLSLAYLLPVVTTAFFRPAAQPETAYQEAPWPCLLAMGVTALGCLALFFAPQPLQALASAAAGGVIWP